jgi:hypothetical protein
MSRAADRPLPQELLQLLHDLRGPLNAALLELEVLKRALSGEAGARVEKIDRQLRAHARMLPAAFEVLRGDAGPRDEKTPQDLRHLVERATSGMPDTTLDPGVWPRVLADENLLELAVFHLVKLTRGTERQPLRVSPMRHGTQAGVQMRRPGRELRSATKPAASITIDAPVAGLGEVHRLARRHLIPASYPGEPAVRLLILERIAFLERGALALEASAEGGLLVTFSLPAA